MEMRSRTGRAALVVMAWVAVVATPTAAATQEEQTARAMTADVAGAWTLEVETDQGVTTPSWVLEQDGTSLTGSYSSAALGENRIRGSVDGSDVRIAFTATIQGQGFPVVYEGTLDDDGLIRGTIDIAGGMMQGRFTATRTDG
jgi:hypothetical protein